MIFTTQIIREQVKLHFSKGDFDSLFKNVLKPDGVDRVSVVQLLFDGGSSFLVVTYY